MKLDAKGTVEEMGRVALKDLSAYGGFIFYLVVAAVFYLVGAYAFSSILISSLAAVTIVIAAIRFAYFKPRPGMKSKKYNVIYERIDNSSFPSIHVARAIMLSMAFFLMAPATLPLLAFLVIAVCTSRLYFKRHDMIDIAAGAVVGFVMGWIFFIAL